MATLLYRLGRFSFRRAWTVIAAWAVVAAVALGTGLALGGQMQESFAIPGTESQAAIDRLAAVFPETAGASAQIVLQAGDGDTLRDHEALIDDVATDLTELEPIAQALSPFSEYATSALADDERTGVLQLQFIDPSEQVDEAALAEVDTVAEQLSDAGLRVEFGGMLYQDVEYGVTVTELLGVAVAGLVLLITFGSLLAAGMPLISAIVGIAISMGGVLAVAAVTPISNATPMLALMLGLAVGIDYGLFILSRHRRQLAAGMDPVESAGLSVGTAGSAVVFAGVTVVIALLGLLVVGIPFLSAMGIAAASAVALAVLASVTLLPAMFGLAGSRLAPKPGSRAARRESGVTGDGSAPVSFGTRWVRGVMKAPIVIVVAVVAALGALAIPATSMQLALPSGGSDPAGSTAREAYDLIADELGEGVNGPLVLAVDITQTDEVLEVLDEIADAVRDLDGVATVGGGLPNPTIDTGIVQIVPTTGPADAATADLVHRIRDLVPDLEQRTDTEISVTGATAVQIDISQRLDDALLPFGIIVVGLSIVLLMMVFRSVLVPIKAALGFVLSVLASFGVVVAVFQWGIGADLIGITPGPVLSFMPILLMAVLFGLAMDYEVFLVSGMREQYVHGATPRVAIERGFAGAARVVTAAALIMFFVFIAFVPEGAGVIKLMALGLAVGVFVDAFLVRMTLVPALMVLMGRAAWWLPKWLGRLLPNVDIEGERLAEHREAVVWASTQHEAALSAEGLEVAGAGPVDVVIPHGGVATIEGELRLRMPLQLTLAGRMTPAAGRAQVLGNPLPSDAEAVRRTVAVIDANGTSAGAVGGTTGRELARDRLALRHPWRPDRSRSALAGWQAQVDAVVGAVPGGSGARGVAATEAPLEQLSGAQRALVLAATALVEQPSVLVVETGEVEASVLSVVIDGLRRLAPQTTLVIGCQPLGRAPDVAARPLVRVQLTGAHAAPAAVPTDPSPTPLDTISLQETAR